MRANLAINFAKFTSWLIKSSNLGNASSLPGKLALKIEPNLLKYCFKKKIKPSKEEVRIAVTGTNGKTSTVGLLKSIFLSEIEDYIVPQNLVVNDLGANLYYGICTSLIEEHSSEYINYLLEVDEAAFANICRDIKPSIIAVTNLYRDQLDRFGELNATQKMIFNGIQATDALLVLNADNQKVAELGEAREGAYFYSLRLEPLPSPIKDQDVDLEGQIMDFDSESSLVSLEFRGEEPIHVKLPLPGRYNVYNALAAALPKGSLNWDLFSR